VSPKISIRFVTIAQCVKMRSSEKMDLANHMTLRFVALYFFFY
jgi:hypothetical protein